MKNNRLFLMMSLLAVGVIAAAQGPNNTGTYYSSANGKKGAALKTAMHNIIKNPDAVSYSGLKEAYTKTDVRPDGYLRDWYSNITSYVPGSAFGSYSKEGDAYNREHSMPQSWFSQGSPMRSDIVHVIPTDGYINNMRSDNPFGEVTENGENVKQSAGGYSKCGAPKSSLGVPSSVTKVFEPNDEVKGDIARIYFYMTTCYEDKILSWTNGTAGQVIGGTEYEPLLPWVMQMMLRWAKQDTIDATERARNAACYEVQKNRNPFVDYPGLEEYIWGYKKDSVFSYNNYAAATGSTTDNPDNPDNPDPTEPEKPAVQSDTILLNNTFFGCSWTGTRPSGGNTQLTGRQGGITVVYAMGDGGSNMYCNDSQIRLYQKNSLTVSVSDNSFTNLSLVLAKETSKTLQSSVGSVDGFAWSGDAAEVTFCVDEGSGNAQVSSLIYTLKEDPTAVERIAEGEVRPVAIYSLDGRRLSASQRGLRIVRLSDGRTVKVMR